MLIDNPLKFHQDILNGSQVTERKRFVTDRQTDRRLEQKEYVPDP